MSALRQESSEGEKEVPDLREPAEEGLKIRLPLRVVLPRKRTVDKRLALNLNVFRNTHYHVLDDAKKILKEIVQAELSALDIERLSALQPPLCFTYTMFPGTARKTDLGNVLPIVQKFCDDALVELGVIEDDNYEVLQKVVYGFGGLDRKDPRVELEIDEYRPERATA